MDAVAIYVHSSNPLASQGLTLAQLDAILSTTRHRGHEQDINTWGDVGLRRDWVDAPIHIYTRNQTSGTTGVLKTSLLRDGTFKSPASELFSSAAVVDAVAGDPHGIGFSSIGYARADVAVVPLIADGADTAVHITPDSVHNGAYPLSRQLYLTLDIKPQAKLPAAHAEFLRFVLSRPGQQQVARAGLLPLHAESAEQMLREIGLLQAP